MELKPKQIITDINLPFVLIVPYGIETNALHVLIKPLSVLIVPYGIETHIGFSLSVCLQKC